MWVRKRLDMSWFDLNYAMMKCSVPLRSRREQIEEDWSAGDDSFVCLSVRTGFDLLLQALQLPAGSEVLMSALTIDGMVRIVREHGLVPVPIDVDIDTLAPNMDILRRAVNSRTRLFVVAHLFGGQLELSPLKQLCREHDLLLVEDCAQAFDGVPNGRPAIADCSLFSFGPIKTSTALGGGVMQCQDPDLLGQIKQIEHDYPVQSRWNYFQRLLKYGALMSCSNRWLFSTLSRSLALVGKDYDGVLQRAVRGFAESNYLDRLRKQPSLPLLSLLHRRLVRFDPPRMQLHRERGDWLRAQLPQHVSCPGHATQQNNYWVFPIMVDNPEYVIEQLRRGGFDAMQQGSMVVVPAPEQYPELDPVVARQVLEKTVFLPLYPQMPQSSLDKMVGLLESLSVEPA
jgi:perosamine synthetase